MGSHVHVLGAGLVGACGGRLVSVAASGAAGSKSSRTVVSTSGVAGSEAGVRASVVACAKASVSPIGFAGSQADT